MGTLNSVLVEGEVEVGFSQLTEPVFVIRAKAEGEDFRIRVRIPVSKASLWVRRLKVGQMVRIVGHLVPVANELVSLMAEHIEISGETVPESTGG